MELISESLSTDPIDRDERDSMLIEMFLTLIRNLCCIENTRSNSGDNRYAYHSVHSLLFIES